VVHSKIASPSFIYLYGGAGAKSLDLGEIARYLKETIGSTKVELRDEFITHALSRLSPEGNGRAIGALAARLANSKVRNPTIKDTDQDSMLGEIEYEKRCLLNPKNKPFGILYDGFKLQDVYFNLIPEPEREFSHLHIVITNQLFGTWDENDRRYHARVSVYGFPSIVSTTGIVEAPAKPREFYLKRQLGIDLVTLKREFKGRFIDYDDPRLTEVVKGYMMQALFLHMMGDPFCEDKNCRLYNAHWQEEVIQAQLESNYEFCERHDEIIAQLKEGKPWLRQ